MSGPIGRVPRGLLDFFQLTTQGRNPSQLADTIAPTFDVLRWYVDGQSGDLTASTTLLGIGSATGDRVPFTTTAYGSPLPDNGVVPSTEVWLLRMWTISGSVIPTSPNVMGWVPMLFAPNDSTPDWIPPHQREGSSANVIPHVQVLELPMLIPPGYQMGMMLQGVPVSTVAYSVTSTVRLSRFHI